MENDAAVVMGHDGLLRVGDPHGPIWVAETTDRPRHEWARDPEERYGVYVVVPLPRPTEPRQLATCAQDGIGVALVTLAAEGEFDGLSVGVLDGVTGTWIVNPYGANRKAET